MVRAGERGRLFDVFKEKGVVAVGWGKLGDLSAFKGREAIIAAVKKHWPDWKDGHVINSAGTLHRFAFEMHEGDRVLTYDPSRRVYLVGSIAGPYKYAPGSIEDLDNVRKVSWDGEVGRDALPISSRSPLSSALALFLVPPAVAETVEKALKGEGLPQSGTSEPDARGEERAIEESALEDSEERAKELIKDRISKLTWEEMQELVAGILRAMGYKTRVSPVGPDQGKDIIASPDGLGFEQPRIIVEVKHRSAATSSQQIRSFLGGRHPNDRLLYVSTGGFTKDALYEAERSSIPLTPMDLEDLARVLIENYEKLDVETKQLVPLRKVYWPT